MAWLHLENIWDAFILQLYTERRHDEFIEFDSSVKMNQRQLL